MGAYVREWRGGVVQVGLHSTEDTRLNCGGEMPKPEYLKSYEYLRGTGGRLSTGRFAML
jgi:hypothetical protein